MTNRMVVSTLDGGMCNSIKSLVSALRMHKGAKTTSPKLATCLASSLCIKREDVPSSATIIDNWRLVVLPEDVEIEGQLNVQGEKSVSWDLTPGARHVDLGYWLLPDAFKERMLKAWTLVKPSRAMGVYVDEWVDKHLGGVDGGIVGVHVRSWGNSHWDRAIGSWNGDRSFALEDYINEVERMAKTYDPAVYKYFLCADHEDHIHALRVALPRFEFVHHANNQGLNFFQNAFVDLCLLSRCAVIVGKIDSTFTEVAWWMGGCKAKVVLV